jgi:hypothetical protein
LFRGRKHKTDKYHKSIVSKVIVATLLCFNGSTFAEAANPRPGEKCNKLGISKKYEEKLFTCKLIKKKLVWSKGISLLPKIPKPNKQLNYAEVNWDNLEKYGFDLIYKLWGERDSSLPSSKSKVTRSIYIGPNSSLKSINPNAIFDDADKFFGWIESDYEYSVFYFNKQDEGWAKQKFIELYGKEPFIGNICRSSFCSGGNAGIADSKYLNINLGLDTPREGVPTGFIEFHEYVHIVQMALARDQIREVLRPQWLVEGHANFMAMLALSKSLEEYSKNRAGYRGERTAPLPTVAELESFLSRQSALDLESLDGKAYNWGFYFSEILSIVYGVDATIRLYKNLSNTGSFELAVESTFGESWESLIPKVARGALFIMNGLRQ